eukprot:gene8175-3_t
MPVTLFVMKTEVSSNKKRIFIEPELEESCPPYVQPTITADELYDKRENIIEKMKCRGSIDLKNSKKLSVQTYDNFYLQWEDFLNKNPLIKKLIDPWYVCFHFNGDNSGASPHNWINSIGDWNQKRNVQHKLTIQISFILLPQNLMLVLLGILWLDCIMLILLVFKAKIWNIALLMIKLAGFHYYYMQLAEKIIKPSTITETCQRNLCYNDFLFVDFHLQEIIHEFKTPKPKKTKIETQQSVIKVLVGNQNKMRCLLERELGRELGEFTIDKETKTKLYNYLDLLKTEFQDINSEDLDTYVNLVSQFIEHFEGIDGTCSLGIFGLCKYNIRRGTKPKVCKTCHQHKSKRNRKWVEFRSWIVDNICDFQQCPCKG